MSALADPTDVEMISGGVGVRRVVVGALRTNCWIAFSLTNRTAVVVDPGDEPQRLIDATTDLRVASIVLTHTHWDHVLALPAVSDAWGCPVLAHPDDAPVWPHEVAHLCRHGHFDAGTATEELLDAGTPPRPAGTHPTWDGTTVPLAAGERVALDADTAIQVLHTPGHTPGGISLLVGGHLFSGDTLFPGGPGLTGWPLSDFATIMVSVRRLLTLPPATVVHPGHGRSTTIGAERPHVELWQARGW